MKQKTHKALSKRIRVTKTGKMMKRHAGFETRFFPGCVNGLERRLRQAIMANHIQANQVASGEPA